MQSMAILFWDFWIYVNGPSLFDTRLTFRRKLVWMLWIRPRKSRFIEYLSYRPTKTFNILIYARANGNNNFQPIDPIVNDSSVPNIYFFGFLAAGSAFFFGAAAAAAGAGGGAAALAGFGFFAVFVGADFAAAAAAGGGAGAGLAATAAAAFAGFATFAGTAAGFTAFTGFSVADAADSDTECDCDCDRDADERRRANFTACFSCKKVHRLCQYSKSDDVLNKIS